MLYSILYMLCLMVWPRQVHEGGIFELCCLGLQFDKDMKIHIMEMELVKFVTT